MEDIDVSKIRLTYGTVRRLHEATAHLPTPINLLTGIKFDSLPPNGLVLLFHAGLQASYPNIDIEVVQAKLDEMRISDLIEILKKAASRDLPQAENEESEASDSGKVS